MVIKKLLLLVLTISIFAVSGNALERKKPLPLKELQNPKSPSYVPLPYSQTRDEIIAYNQERNLSSSIDFCKSF